MCIVYLIQKVENLACVLEYKKKRLRNSRPLWKTIFLAELREIGMWGEEEGFSFKYSGGRHTQGIISILI